MEEHNVYLELAANLQASYLGLDTCGEGKPYVVILIPAYNEERFIGTVVLKARQYTEIVIVVDDGSIDHTAQIAKAAGAYVISHRRNLGKAAALNTGFRAARSLKLDVLITLDGDGQHLLEEALEVAAPILANQADVVIGSRYLRDRSKVPRHRAWGHLFINFITGSFSRVYTSDSQSGFRAFSPMALSQMCFRSSGFSVESEMQFLIQEKHLKVMEVPITARYDDKPKRPAFTHGLLVINGLICLTERYRPSIFFGFGGLISFLLGIVWKSLITDGNDSQLFSLGANACETLLYLLGILALFAAIVLHPIRVWLLDLHKVISVGKREDP